MRPIVSVVGESGSGKTTLLVHLIVELKKRGYRVVVIKHAHEEFELDNVGKDTWRLSQVGSELVAISMPHKLAIIKHVQHDLSLRELTRFFDWDYDLILTEGFTASNTLKIEVHRKEQGRELICSPKQLLAVVTDEPLDINVSQFTQNEIRGLADLVENWLLAQLREVDIQLFVNHTFIPINLFVKDILARTIIGIVSGLKGIKEISSLRISLRRQA